LAGGGVHRVLSFTRYLPEHGWDCTVICAGVHDYWVRDESLVVPSGAEVIRVSGGSALSAMLRMNRGGGTGRRSGRSFAPLRGLGDWFLIPDSYAGWARRAEAVAAKRLAAGGIDALLTSSPPDSTHLAGLSLADRFRVPWVADFRDPWIGLHFRTPPTAWHHARQASLERRVLERAELTLTASRTHLESLGRRSGARVLRAAHLPNGFEPFPVSGITSVDTTRFRLAFTGTLSLMEDAGTLLKAIQLVLERRPEAREQLRVDLAGPYDTDYESRAASLGLGGVVEFHGPLAHQTAREMQRSADALLLWKPRAAGYATMVPGKLYEYLDSARPIVALLPADDEAGAWVAAGGGVVTPPGDAVALAQVIETMYTMWRQRGRVPDGRLAWLDEHARPRLTAELARMLNSITGGNP
ncbi:MAG: glycosyltransferase, partial [Candidatus Eisenbacteria bacterium]